MSGANTVRATVVPSHGVGAILPPWKPGQSGNPSGRPMALREVRALGKEASPDAMRAMIRIVRDVDKEGRNLEDGRVVVVAAQTILTWTYGKPPDYDPREDRPAVGIDISRLSAADRATMLRILRSGILQEQGEVVEGEATP